MSALAHMLEERGLATVAIAAVRAQAEKTRPPRALWTSSMLGRPFGEPGDAGFQRQVLMAALGLLNRPDGPVILEEFTQDPPGWTDNPGWVKPAVTSASFADELAMILPLWHQAQARFGRTSVGLSFQVPNTWVETTRQFLAGALPSVPQLETPALTLRFLCDDIKALYGEAAQAIGPAPSANQVDTWFWRQTAAGALLNALRTMAMASENKALKTVGGRFFVPAIWVV